VKLLWRSGGFEICRFDGRFVSNSDLSLRSGGTRAVLRIVGLVRGMILEI
jgi:hypothetical protein